MSNSKWPPGQIQVAIILWVSPIYALTLLRGTHFGQNAKFLLILQSSNDESFLAAVTYNEAFDSLGRQHFK